MRRRQMKSVPRFVRSTDSRVLHLNVSITPWSGSYFCMSWVFHLVARHPHNTVFNIHAPSETPIECRMTTLFYRLLVSVSLQAYRRSWLHVRRFGDARFGQRGYIYSRASNVSNYELKLELLVCVLGLVAYAWTILASASRVSPRMEIR